MTCIFLSASAFATIRFIAPDWFERLLHYERRFQCTIKRTMPLNVLADRGEVFDIVRRRSDLVAAALSDRWNGKTHTNNWQIPAGAFGENSGPS